MRFSLLSLGLLLARHDLADAAEASASASVPGKYGKLSAPTHNETIQATCAEEAVEEDDFANSYRRATVTEGNVVETTFGIAQNVGDVDHREEIFDLLDGTEQYMVKVNTDAEFRSVRNNCRNQHESCTFWSVLGECESNPAYMTIQCAPACHSCAQILYENRCPWDPEETKSVFEKPGDVSRMFERIISDPALAHLEPNVISRPHPSEDESDVLEGPWMLVFENFISAEEADRLVELGALEGYERSADVGAMKFDGTFDSSVNSGRTSHNSWCQNDCAKDPVAIEVAQRIEDVTHVPYNNSEYLQMLRYERDQFYNVHHDLIEHQQDRQPGVRILTLYMYLNDVEEGGGTEFPEMGVTVTPKKGRAALWPSVLDDDPTVKEPMTFHAALPVEKGIKYGANAWLHQRDFKNPNLVGCT